MLKSLTRPPNGLQKQAIAEAEKRFHQAIYEAPIPIMVSEDNGKVVELNRAWQEATGYSMAEIQTLESWSQLALSEQYGTLMSSILKLRESNESKFPLRVFTRIKNGTVRSWLLYAALLGNQTDKTAILLSAVDLTERENAEAERGRF